MSSLKRFLLDKLYGIEARRWLYHIHHADFNKLLLKKDKIEAARIWPKYFDLVPKVIFDIGANNGSISKQFLYLFNPTFLGIVEPQPLMINTLNSSFLEKSNCHIFPFALGRKPGKAKMNILESNPSSTFLKPNPKLSEIYHLPLEIKEEIEVEIKTLDSIVSEAGLDSIDLIKIDVEGFELEVFSGAEDTLNKTRYIVSEVLFFEAQEGRPLFIDVYSYLSKLNFELIGLFGATNDKDGNPLYRDAVFKNKSNLN